MIQLEPIEEETKTNSAMDRNERGVKMIYLVMFSLCGNKELTELIL